MVKEENQNFLHKYAVQTETEAFENSTSIEEYRQALNAKIAIITQKFHEKLETQAYPADNENSYDETILVSVKEQEMIEIVSNTPKKIKPSPKESPTKLIDQKEVHLEEDKKQVFNIFVKSENLNSVLKIIEELITCPESSSILNFLADNTGDSIIQIKENLTNHKYSDIRRLNKDMDLLFTNCLTKYKKGTRNYKNITKLEKLYFDYMDSWMKNFGFCCGIVYKFEPRELICQVKKFCTIPVNQSYHKYKKYCYCEACFRSINSDIVEIIENITQPAL